MRSLAPTPEDIAYAREENERLVKILAKEREDAKAQLAEADRHAKWLEDLLEPYLKWDGKPSEVERLTAELAKAREALERIAKWGTVAGMHEQDRDEKLRNIARAALQPEEKR